MSRMVLNSMGASDADSLRQSRTTGADRRQQAADPAASDQGPGLDWRASERHLLRPGLAHRQVASYTGVVTSIARIGMVWGQLRLLELGK